MGGLVTGWLAQTAGERIDGALAEISRVSDPVETRPNRAQTAPKIVQRLISSVCQGRHSLPVTATPLEPPWPGSGRHPRITT